MILIINKMMSRAVSYYIEPEKKPETVLIYTKQRYVTIINLITTTHTRLFVCMSCV